MHDDIYKKGEEVWCDGETLDEIRNLPYYNQVPKEKIKNLEYRARIIDQADRDHGAQQAILKACAEDFLFWASTFVFVFEPRPRPKVLPFIPWKHQEQFLYWMDHYLGRRDMGILKSRGEGASWCGMMLFTYHWIFGTSEGGVGPAFGVASRNEDAVDKSNDPDSLFWKIDFILDSLPRWMIPFWNPRNDRSLKNHVFLNRESNATIVGYSATGDLGTGGRKTAYWMDEMAKFLTISQQQSAMNSTQHTTECRILCSTPKGDSGTFYDAMHVPSSMLKIVLHWTNNDTRRRGMYSSTKAGELRVFDKDYVFPNDYPYILDQKKRSPWYDLQCSRPGATPTSIAQELDLDFAGSTYKFFDMAVEKAKETFCPPVLTGEISFDDSLLIGSFIKSNKGKFKLWRALDHENFPKGAYIVSCDVASGTSGDYVSNSVLQILDRKTGEQVAEFATSSMLPQDFAFMSVSVCRWIEQDEESSAYLIWDKLGGAGSQYTQAIIEQTRYRNIYFSNPKRELDAIRGKRKPSPGFVSRDPEKVLGRLRDRIIRSEVTVHSVDLVRELSEWEYDAGRLIHVPSKVGDDQSAKGLAHGDRVMALAIGIVGFLERPLVPEKEQEVEIPYGSLAWREQKWDQDDHALKEQKHEYSW